MKILKAEHLGMCFGVRDAITLAKSHAAAAPLTILGELVHNENVLSDLARNGIRIEHDVANVTTPTVMITAHGTSENRLNDVRQKGFNVLEATCPLVHFAHRSLRKLVDAGYHPVIIGKRNHVEVHGMIDDLTAFDVVLTAEDVEQLQEKPRFGIVSQTTQPIEKVQNLITLMHWRFPNAELRFIDTVCQPTKQRQLAAVALAQKSDVVIVVGGANSNNTRELVTTCRTHCDKVFHVQTANDVRGEWFNGALTVGITAGTSTPDCIIDGVEHRIAELAQRQEVAA